ncbi:lipocalin [Corynebacterium sp. 13CS0277]|uniref:lipocalin family protein n=1 Tax=Corynebacterium sp. 13CS0277 TaxID=2071994 RepID=UPI000D02BEFE|nr:lipocalin family protein [Corynebacterium sp. 13CS0277]PRQ11603.1 lipocalin [Corynebacterium sp. 13CS0277]
MRVFPTLLPILATGALALGLAAPAAAQDQGFTGVPTADLSSTANFGSSAPAGLEMPRIDSLEELRGTWYQVAAIPTPFNLQCAKNTTATYEVLSPEMISVRNACTDWFGGASVINGRARLTGAENNNELRVAFNDIPFQNIDGPANYQVRYRNAEKTLMVIGSPNGLSGFVLSRTPDVSEATLRDTLRPAIAAAGWNPMLFVTSPQDGGLQHFRSLAEL